MLKCLRKNRALVDRRMMDVTPIFQQQHSSISWTQPTADEACSALVRVVESSPPIVWPPALTMPTTR